MSILLKPCKHKGTGAQFTMVGVAAHVGLHGSITENVVIFHPDCEPNNLYTMTLADFQELYEEEAPNEDR